MRTWDEEIAHRLQEAAESGELARAQGYGKPLAADPGWDSTPDALRMPMKILKDAGVAPPEVALFHERARLKALLEAASEPERRRELQLELHQLEQLISLRLESLRSFANR